MPTIDNFEGMSTGLDSPPRHWVAVTPNDDAGLSNTARVLLIGGGGTLRVTCDGGEDTTFPATIVYGGGQHIIGVFEKVWETGTTATDIYAGW